MTLFEVIIICIVAAMFVATIFVFLFCIPYIKQVRRLNQQVITLTNAAYECRSFLEKLSKHDVIVKINKITDLEKKVGEVTGICKNQTNNITQVSDNLDKALEDIKMRNKLISDNHKLLDNINKSNSSANINKNIFTAYEDLKDKILKIDQQYAIIINNIDALIKGHNKGIDATRKAFEVINSRNDVADNTIDKTYNDIKSVLKDIAKISSVLDSYREKINYITTYIENATKLKTATKTKMVQSKTTTTPINKKGVQKY